MTEKNENTSSEERRGRGGRGGLRERTPSSFLLLQPCQQVHTKNPPLHGAFAGSSFSQNNSFCITDCCAQLNTLDEKPKRTHTQITQSPSGCVNMPLTSFVPTLSRWSKLTDTLGQRCTPLITSQRQQTNN